MRTGVLKRLYSIFFEQLKDVDSPVVAIVGNSAEGKTELAKQYASHFRDQYHHIWFVQVENWEAEYRNRARLWGLFSEAPRPSASISIGVLNAKDNASVSFQTVQSEELPIDVIIHRVHRVLGGQSGQKKSLIIFDNAPAGFFFKKLKMQLPSNTHILTTSKDSEWENKLSLTDEACQLTLEEGIEILRGWIGDQRFDLEEAKSIVRELGHLPVALAHAGGYVAKNLTMEITNYLTLFKRNRSKVLAQGKHSGQVCDIVASLHLILDQLPPKALELLRYCAYLPGKGIPADLLRRLMVVDEINFNELLAALGTLVISDTGQVTIHDLFQDILIEEMAIEEKEKCLSSIAGISEEYAEFLLSNRNKAVPIYQQGLKEAEKRGDKTKVTNFANRLGDLYFTYGGNYLEALPYFEKVLKFVEKPSEKVKAFYDIGKCYFFQGDYNKAWINYQDSLKLGETQLDTDDPLIALSLNGIANCYSSRGIYAESLEYHQRVLKLRKVKLGVDHPDVAWTLTNMGYSYYDQMNYEEAFRHHKMALAIYEKTYGREHISVALNLNGIGNYHYSKQDYEKALKFHEEALKINQKKLDKDHPRIAMSLKNIGDCYCAKRDQVKALQNYEEALRIRQWRLAKNHIDIAQTFYSMANCHFSFNQFKQALEFYNKALEIYQFLEVSTSHPDALQCLERIKICKMRCS